MACYPLTALVLLATLSSAVLAEEVPLREGDVRATPPFEWAEGFATPGFSLRVSERGRSEGVVDYHIEAGGFDGRHDLSLWLMSGETFFSIPAQIDTRHIVRVAPEDLRRIRKAGGPSYTDPRAGMGLLNRDQRHRDDVSLEGAFVQGESLDIALWDPATGSRAHAKTVPFPIKAKGKGSCRGSAELIRRDPVEYLVRLSGLQPDADVRVSRASRTSPWTETRRSAANGEVMFRVALDQSKLLIQASDGKCTVELNVVPGPRSH